MDFAQSLGFGVLFKQVLGMFFLAFSWFPYWGPLFLAYVFLVSVDSLCTSKMALKHKVGTS